ncbi:uncharacterized protein LOC129774309 [Toxorhynchites rutilus septentrionalis]|uniref:uncharacterized protein LOC129774309 n=1 Tax=Toxorhynchites rutilus septentrionalis TaxID=329112 RepID=UPI002478E5D4|nr:uncharacterized protein LOC129774309 [Toxorhynchites rutilus septentrionalis]
MAPSLRTLSRQERFCTDSMKNLVDQVSNYDEQSDKNLLEGRVEEIFAQFQSVRLQIELEEDEGKSIDTSYADEEENRRIRDEFERNYMMVYGFIVTELSKQTNTDSDANKVIVSKTRDNSDQMFSRIKLPEVKLPSFDGSITNWLTFRDIFVSMIDSNSQLKPVDKFTYLLSSLPKEAKRVIESVELTGANYAVAWELLNKRFDNKKLVVKNYIDSLLSIEPMRRECYESLTRIIDDFERNLSMIQKMGIPTDGWSVLLAHMLCARLEGATLKMWEQHHKSTDVPTYEDLIEFLRGHASVLQSLSSSYKSRNPEFAKTEPVRPMKPKLIHAVTSNLSSKLCIFCKQGTHSAFHCDALRKMNDSQRFDAVKRSSLCINCLSPSHLVKQCPSSSCRVCGQKHHTMLHQNATFRTPDPSNSKHIPPESILESNRPQPSRKPLAAQPLANPSAQPSNIDIPSTSTTTSCISTTLIGNIRTVPSTVLLQTAVVKVSNLNGYAVWARAWLDPASQINLITEQLAQRLTLRRYKNHQEIGGVGNSQIISSHSVVARIHSHCSNFIADFSLHVLPGITRELPSRTIHTEKWKLPKNIVLADPTFNEPSPIDMILGMEVYYDLIEDGLIRLGPEQPVLQKTVLGWVVSGKVGPPPSTTPSFTHVCKAQSYDNQLARLFELETCQTSSTFSVEETYCEAHVSNTTTRYATGRFFVRLPKRSDKISTLGSSKEVAARRFFSLERRLTLNSSLKKSYCEFIEEYRRLGHMIEASPDKPNSNLPTYYLPHHCIVKPESLTTKLRVVFDASCATDTGVSLNDVLMVGLVVQDDLIAIILRFRMFRYAIISDIEKMFRQIVVHPSDCQLQQILWRDSPTEPLKTYQLTTVTYGMSSAPYLATRCLKELAKIGENEYPLAARVTSNDFYMDDLLTGVNDIATGRQLCAQLIQLHQSAGFCLRKWSSNCPPVLEMVPPSLRDERTLLELEPSSNPIKTLGLQWQTTTDQFLFNVPRWNDCKTFTKRVILSDAAKLFDPLGLVGPAIVTAKIYLQHLWRNQKNGEKK